MCRGITFDYNSDEVGQVVLGEIPGDVDEEFREDVLVLQGRRVFGELRRDQGTALELEESVVDVVLSEKLVVGGYSPGPVHAIDAGRGSLEANRHLGDRIVAVE